MDTVVFWIYSYVMETLLPIGFYSLMVESLVISRVFSKLFEIIDPNSYLVMKNAVQLWFIKELLSIFTLNDNAAIKLAVMDMLMLLGSGSTTSTITQEGYKSIYEQTVYNDKNIQIRPLCRTIQLLIALGFAILRIVIYDTQIKQKIDEEINLPN